MRHLFFDLDRTLWDFERNSEVALFSLFEDLDLASKVRTFQSFHTQYKRINARLWDLYGRGEIEKSVLRVKRFDDTLRAFDVKDSHLAEALASGYVERSPYQTNLFPNTLETLRLLKEEGYPMHIITNGFKEVQHIKLDNSGLREFFDVIIISEEVGANKPAMKVFHSAIEQAGATAEASVMIGDNYNADIIGAQNSGMQAIFFDPGFEHRDDSHPWLIRDLAKIPELLPYIPLTKD